VWGSGFDDVVPILAYGRPRAHGVGANGGDSRGKDLPLLVIVGGRNDPGGRVFGQDLA